MHKDITKNFITLLLVGVLLTGCDRKDADIVLAEPETAVADSGAPALEDNTEEMKNSSDTGSLEADKSDEKSDNKSEEASKVEESKAPETIMVHVCGAVLCEGVYELPTGSRVVDAIKAAGGFLQDADSDFVNQATILEDGVKIKIPTVEESMATGDGADDTASAGSDDAGITGAVTAEAESSSESGKVNINTASESELCDIPGIGQSRAKNIIAYREENGKFGTIEDIMKVTGIKDKFFSKIKDHIKV
ncbi:MAG: helix-hairpin-helix domain-containing protein [Butyrivibrio sp.]|nr:helix-hairpin-helix domain-containing protein [Butyrivibrio sp.]